MAVPTKTKWFDPTINLGQVITAMMVLMVGIAGWYDLQRRVSILEDARIMSRQLYQARVAAVDAQVKDLNIDLRDLRLRVDQLSDAQNKKPK